jgi:ABC-type glutathione transport system ATPase component
MTCGSTKIGVGEVEAVRDYLDAEVTPDVDGANAAADHRSGGQISSLAAVTAPHRRVSPNAGTPIRDGVDLSGGEWQKVALAAPTCAMRNFLLDEPTAALDARAKYDVFVRFNELMSAAWES